MLRVLDLLVFLSLAPVTVLSQESNFASLFWPIKAGLGAVIKRLPTLTSYQGEGGQAQSDVMSKYNIIEVIDLTNLDEDITYTPNQKRC